MTPKKHWYFVFLDPRTIVGNAYLDGNNDGISESGCPMLRCSDIDMSQPLLFASRKPSKGPSRQDVYLPYSAIASIFRADDQDDDPPFGFSLQQTPKK